jgi:competence ComEA-like helix-hairpin-helix protein
MDAAPPTDASPPPVPASAPSPPVPALLSVRWPSKQWFPTVSAVWPRSAQLATAFLLGLAVALLGIQLWSMSRWNTRPLKLEREKRIQYRIDLNSAQREQLLQVPGIGERTAEKIEAYRNAHGPFQSKAELTQIPGIGPAKYEKMSDWVTTRPSEGKVIADTSTISSPPRLRADNPTKSSNTRKSSKKEELIKAPIDVNQADFEELQKLPGIGPKLAQRIVDERAKSPFRAVEDLRRVSGIGPKILERLRPFVSVRPASNRVVSDATTRK